MNFHTISWITILTVWLTMPAYGKDEFDLFNPDRGKPPPPPAPKVQQPPANPFMRPPPPKKEEPPPPVAPPPKPLLPQKDFTLRGTSRIGDRYAAVLQGPDGNQFIQYLEDNKRTEIKGYPGFALLQVESRKVTIAYPADAPCRTSSGDKVQCSQDQKAATLKLVALDALPQQQQPFQPPQPFQPQPVPMAPVPAITPIPNAGITPAAPMPSPFGMITPPPPLSPEEQRRREEEQKRRAEIYKNFKRQIIKDEDVPPGMRVVHTPFGDRLVPDNK